MRWLRPNAHQLAQHPPPTDHHNGGAQVDRQILKPGSGGIANSAVECPSGAVDRERERVDQRLAHPGPASAQRRTLGGESDKKQQDHITQTDKNKQIERGQLSVSSDFSTAPAPSRRANQTAAKTSASQTEKK